MKIISTILFIIGLWSITATAQVTYSGNNNGAPPNSYLGWDWANNLDFRTNNINRMRLMQTGSTIIDQYPVSISGNLALSSDPSFFSNGNKPFSLLHLNGEDNLFGPQMQGFRPWMRNGITFTNNGDLMYVGPMKKGSGTDKTDAVIAWSDNYGQGPVGPDVLRFLFTHKGQGATNISSDPMNGYDLDGREVARFMGDARMGVGPMWTDNLAPKRSLDVSPRNDDKPQFRITYTAGATETSGRYADFQVSKFSNLHLKPTADGTNNRTVAIGFLDGELAPVVNHATLDVGGITRVRKLPDAWDPKVLIMGYELADVNADDDDDYMLGRIDFPTEDPECFVLNGEGEWTNICDGIGGADMDWEYDATDVWTGHGLNGYPDGKVGIGIIGASTQAKLHVYSNKITYGNQAIGISVFTDPGGVPVPQTKGIEIWSNGGSLSNIGTMTYIVGNTATTNTGHEVKCAAQGLGNYGYRANIEGASYANYGAKLEAINYGSAWNYGVWGEACDALRNIGVYGKTCGTDNGNFAGYFDGDVYSSGQYSGSDENLKQDIQNIENPSDILNSLNPKTYFYQDISQMSLSSAKQYGLLAQELEEVLPELIKEAVNPAITDSLGNIIEEEIIFKAIRYNDLIAILIAGFQEQNTTVAGQAAEIALQNEKIANLEGQLEQQATQLEQMQNDMQSVLAAVQTMQQKTANCCTLKTGRGETGA